MFKKENLIKKIDYEYKQNNMSYIIKSLMVIIQHYKKITIYVVKYEKETELEKELKNLI